MVSMKEPSPGMWISRAHDNFRRRREKSQGVKLLQPGVGSSASETLLRQELQIASS